jgi:hypothetical protein
MWFDRLVDFSSRQGTPEGTHWSGAGIISALIYFLVVSGIPHSPSWLIVPGLVLFIGLPAVGYLLSPRKKPKGDDRP